MPFALSLVLLLAGLYLVLSRPQALWLLIGAELILNAPVPLLIAAGTTEALALVFLLLFFALLEAAAALLLFYGWFRHTGSLQLQNLLAQ